MKPRREIGILVGLCAFRLIFLLPFFVSMRRLFKTAPMAVYSARHASTNSNKTFVA
jgi:hypothetical protein